MHHVNSLLRLMIIQGECFCGEISYHVNKPLYDARSCHCSRCRKAFSAQASAYALVEPGAFEWVRGQNLLSSYVGEQGFGLQFCGHAVQRYVELIMVTCMVLH